MRREAGGPRTSACGGRRGEEKRFVSMVFSDVIFSDVSDVFNVFSFHSAGRRYIMFP